MPKRNPMPTSKGRPPKLVPLRYLVEGYDIWLTGWTTGHPEYGWLCWQVATDLETDTTYTYCESE